MKTVSIVLLFLLVRGTSRLVGQVPPTSTSNPVYTRLQQDEAVEAARAAKIDHEPCVDWLRGSVSPANEEDRAAFKHILDGLHVSLAILLYVSHDPGLKNFGGAMSFQCPIDNHEIYNAIENWTVYDPDLIHGDAARDFVFAHEIAHHLSGDTSSDQPRSKQLELRADYNGAKYLIQLGWTKARLQHALDLLDLPQGPQLDYPTLEERKAAVEAATEPPALEPPSGLWGTLVPRPPYDELLRELLNQKYQGTIRLQSVRTNKYVCGIGTPDPRIPSTKHFVFFDDCELGPSSLFNLRLGLNDGSGYSIRQPVDPCPNYAGICQYALQSVGDNLQFWNQDLAADPYVWEKELGEQELFSFEASDTSEKLVKIKAHKGGYIFVNPKTAKLQNGGSREQAAEFKVLFDSN
ncbi:MAG TPA: hypothetical protein VGS10_21375 [Terracidiphilus sp.]|nr:hypothetical protein [Terracidiphilus sp.]